MAEDKYSVISKVGVSIVRDSAISELMCHFYVVYLFLF